jgi:hypothetical protein
LDAHFGIRGAILTQNDERIVVIEKNATNPDEVMQILKNQHIARIVIVKKIPMNKRHNAKIDYVRLEKMFKIRKKNNHCAS